LFQQVSRLSQERQVLRAKAIIFLQPFLRNIEALEQSEKKTDVPNLSRIDLKRFLLFGF